MIPQTITNSLQLDSGDSDNPWRSRSNDQHPPDNHQRDETDPAFREQTVPWKYRYMISSPSPSPQSVPMSAQPAMQETDTTPADSQIASLKAIFPDFDDAVIIFVLESTDGDHDRALDILLGMNDPSFVLPNPPLAPPQNQPQSQPRSATAPSLDAQRLSQEALDEQLARRLALEEQQAADRAWQPQGMEGQTPYEAYQPRRGGRNGWGVPPQGRPQTQGQGARDTMTEFHEGFNRIAESGKKTFSSIVSKVRAKMQEYDQGQGWSWPQGPPPNQPPQAGSSSYGTGPPQDFEQGAQPYPHAQPARQPSQAQPARTSTPPRLGISRPAQQPSYYDPNVRGYDLYEDDDHAIQIHDHTTTSSSATVPTAAVSATSPRHATPPHVDTTASPPPPPPSNTSSPPSYTSPVSPPHNSGPSLSSPPARSFTPPPPARAISPTTAGARGTPSGVDFSKLGLLPKRPISLVGPQSPPSASVGTVTGSTGAGVSAPRVAVVNSKGTSTTESSTDREEPEFVQNPFEDPK